MSVDFYVYRPDIPDDVAPLCSSEYETDFHSGYAGEDAWRPFIVCVRVNVSFLYDDRLAETYPALYPGFYEPGPGESAKTVPMVHEQLRAQLADALKHPPLFYDHDAESKEKSRRNWNKQCRGMWWLLDAFDRHPDWKVVAES